MTKTKLITGGRAADILHALDEIDWYRRCLENSQGGSPVRNLDEAKVGYERAFKMLVALASPGRSAQQGTS